MPKDTDDALMPNPNGLQYTELTGFRTSHRMRLLYRWQPFKEDLKTLMKLAKESTGGDFTESKYAALSPEDKQNFDEIVRRFEEKWKVILTIIPVRKDSLSFFPWDALFPLPPAPLSDEAANRHHQELAERYPERFFIVDARMAGPELLKHLRQLCPDTTNIGKSVHDITLHEDDLELDKKLIEVNSELAADLRPLTGEKFVRPSELDAEVRKLRNRLRNLKNILLSPDPSIDFP